MIHTAKEALRWRKLAKLSLLAGIAVAIAGVIFNHFILLLALPLFGIWVHAKKMTYRWETGFEGEYSVIEALSKAKRLKGFLLSDIILPGQKANIDHVLICEQGIFLIETKAYTGLYHVSGDEWYVQTSSGKKRVKSISKTAKRYAAVLSAFLRENFGEYHFVNPMIVFTGAGIIEGKSTIPIVSAFEIERYISTLPRKLSEQDIAKIEKLLEPYSNHVMVIDQ